MEKFPEFELENQDGEAVSNNTLTGTTVLYLYPKDNTPGCTTQACDMRDSMADLNELGVTVYGISGDSKQKHKNFIEKNNLNFDLLVDEDFKLSNELGVYGLKKAFGKEFNGISRTTFVIDKDSNILKRFDDVKPKEHADELKSFLKEG